MIAEVAIIVVLNALFFLYNSNRPIKWKNQLIKIVINLAIMVLQFTLIGVLFSTEQFENFKNDQNAEHFGVFDTASKWMLLLYIPIIFLILNIFQKQLFKNGFYFKPYELKDFPSWINGTWYIHQFVQIIVSTIGLFLFLVNSPIRLLLAGFIPDTNYQVFLKSDEYTIGQIQTVSGEYEKGTNKTKTLKQIKKNLNSAKSKNETELQADSYLKEQLDKAIKWIVESLTPSLDYKRIEQGGKKYKSQCAYFIYFLWVLLILPMLFSINSAPAMWFILITFVFYPFINYSSDNTWKVIRLVGILVLISTYLFIVQHISDNAKFILHIVLGILLIGILGLITFGTKTRLIDFSMYNLSLWRMENLMEK